MEMIKLIIQTPDQQTLMISNRKTKSCQTRDADL